MPSEVGGSARQQGKEVDHQWLDQVQLVEVVLEPEPEQDAGQVQGDVAVEVELLQLPLEGLLGLQEPAVEQGHAAELAREVQQDAGRRQLVAVLAGRRLLCRCRSARGAQAAAAPSPGNAAEALGRGPRMEAVSRLATISAALAREPLLPSTSTSARGAPPAVGPLASTRRWCIKAELRLIAEPRHRPPRPFGIAGLEPGA
mmetsp:Transcript_15912/g.49067  ORF Transcript_15912/g.49067 Transcript_15912/m.49067 type:complete len:201 (+) Transcript_15912:163-765(+)